MVLTQSDPSSQGKRIDLTDKYTVDFSVHDREVHGTSEFCLIGLHSLARLWVDQ